MTNKENLNELNPWRNLPLSPPYVLPEDRQYVEDYNALCTQDDNLFHAEIYPEQYAGRFDSKVVFLGKCPGFSPEDASVHRSLSYQKLWKDNIAQTIHDYPLFFLHPDIQDSPCYRWWYSKLKPLIEETSIELVAKEILEIQLFPYHCRMLKLNNSSKSLPSIKFAVKLASSVMQRGAVIIAMQSKALWEEYLPALQSYPYFYNVNSPLSGVVSRRNLPDGFQTILEIISE